MCDLTFPEVTCDCFACSLLTNDSPSPEPKFALLRSALTFTKSESRYEGWLWIGAVIHKETEGCEDGLDLFNSWSKKHSDYRGSEHVYRAWLSFSRDRPWPADLLSLREKLETLGVDWLDVTSQAEDPFFWMEVEHEDYV
jgi:hypothetical protein